MNLVTAGLCFNHSIMSVTASSAPLIAVYTDFGITGPYTGQMEAVLATHAPAVQRVNLMTDAPMFDPAAAGLLLARICRTLPQGVVVLGVVDPGVGGDRLPLIIKTERLVFVGPDNGLFIPALTEADSAEAHIITWRPDLLSRSFHGRDLFAPVAARLAQGGVVASRAVSLQQLHGYGVSAESWRIIYIDHYGNCMTGIDAATLSESAVISVNGVRFHYAEIFSSVPAGNGFWYRNSLDLVELAVNGDSASGLYNLQTGAAVIGV
jgi:S-adenosylmethionine hydrolase